MRARWVASSIEGEVDHDDNLESLIEKSGGDTTNRYRVMKDGKQVETLKMVDLVRSLVPQGGSSDLDATRRAG